MSEAMPRDQMRASDTDREMIVSRLRDAHGEGRLTLAEFDERVQAAWEARTYGELSKITADLPSEGPAVLPSEVPAAAVAPRQRSDGQRKAMRAVTGAWLAASSINFVIWAIVCLSAWSWVYPWWVWVVGPWGAVILAGRVGGFGGRSQRGH